MIIAEYLADNEEYSNKNPREAYFLLNSSPYPDGSIDPIEYKILREASKILKQ